MERCCRDYVVYVRVVFMLLVCLRRTCQPIAPHSVGGDVIQRGQACQGSEIKKDALTHSWLMIGNAHFVFASECPSGSWKHERGAKDWHVGFADGYFANLFNCACHVHCICNNRRLFVSWICPGCHICFLL